MRFNTLIITTTICSLEICNTLLNGKFFAALTNSVFQLLMMWGQLLLLLLLASSHFASLISCITSDLHPTFVTAAFYAAVSSNLWLDHHPLKLLPLRLATWWHAQFQCPSSCCRCWDLFPWLPQLLLSSPLWPYSRGACCLLSRLKRGLILSCWILLGWFEALQDNWAPFGKHGKSDSLTSLPLFCAPAAETPIWQWHEFHLAKPTSNLSIKNGNLNNDLFL